MLLCSLFHWVGWRLSLGQVIPEFYVVPWGRGPWGNTTLEWDLSSASWRG